MLRMIVVDVLYSASAIGTQILLSNKGGHFLVDMGDGTVRDLVSKKTDFGKIRAVLLTHEHFDHFSGLYGFLHFCRLLRRKEELIVIAPRPIEVVGGLLKPPIMYQSLPYEVRLVELGDNETFLLVRACRDCFLSRTWLWQSSWIFDTGQRWLSGGR